MMLSTNIAVSTIVVILIQRVNIVCGLDSSSASDVQPLTTHRPNTSFSVNTSYEISETPSRTNLKQSSPNPTTSSLWQTPSTLIVISTTNSLDETNPVDITSISTTAESSTFQFSPLISSATENINPTISSPNTIDNMSSATFISSSEIDSQKFKISHTTYQSFFPTKSLEIPFSSTEISSVFDSQKFKISHTTYQSFFPTKSLEISFSSTEISSVFVTSSDLIFTTTPLISSTYQDVNSYSTYNLTFPPRSSNSTLEASSYHPSTSALSHSTLNFSAMPVTSSTFEGDISSSIRILDKDNSTVAPSTHHSSISVMFSSTPRLEASSSGQSSTPVSLVHSSQSSFYASIVTSPSTTYTLSSTHLFSSPLPAFSTTMLAGTETIGIPNITSNRGSSLIYSSSFAQVISSISFQTFPSTLLMSSSRKTSFKSLTFVKPTPSEKTTLPIKSSEATNYGELTKSFSSISMKLAPSSSANVLNNIRSFVEFNGKLVVSSKNEHNNLKKLAGSIESILDKALKQVVGYIYSKVLVKTTLDDTSKFECMFKLLLRKSSSETATSLQEKINRYNETNGFGEFTLHSVETSVEIHEPYSEDKLYLWAIIVIAALGVICLLLLAAFIYTRRNLKKSRKRNNSSPKHDNNSNQRYKDLFPAVFDGNDHEPLNVPLKLTSVSSTESKKPLKFSDDADTDSEHDEDNDDAEKKSSQGSLSEGKDDKMAVEDKIPRGNHGTLQIQDTDDEDDQTKFSTFSRKR